MSATVLVTEENGQVKARAFSHVEHFNSIGAEVQWPVYDRHKEMVLFSPATGKLSVVKRQPVQASK